MDSTKEMIWLQIRPDKENYFYLACLFRVTLESRTLLMLY